MPKMYNVWLEIEEADETIDHYQTIDGEKLAAFNTLEAAQRHVVAILQDEHCLTPQRTHETVGQDAISNDS